VNTATGLSAVQFPADTTVPKICKAASFLISESLNWTALNFFQVLEDTQITVYDFAVGIIGAGHVDIEYSSTKSQ
jgi:hypothetical protein